MMFIFLISEYPRTKNWPHVKIDFTSHLHRSRVGNRLSCKCFHLCVHNSNENANTLALRLSLLMNNRRTNPGLSHTRDRISSRCHCRRTENRQSSGCFHHLLHFATTKHSCFVVSKDILLHLCS